MLELLTELDAAHWRYRALLAKCQMLSGSLFSEARGILSVSQDELADRLGVPREYISKLESKQMVPDWPLLAKLLDLLEESKGEWNRAKSRRSAG